MSKLQYYTRQKSTKNGEAGMQGLRNDTHTHTRLCY